MTALTSQQKRALARWRTGKSWYNHGWPCIVVRGLAVTCLRVSIDGSYIQTDDDDALLLRDAKKLWTMARRARRTRKPLRPQPNQAEIRDWWLRKGQEPYILFPKTFHRVTADGDLFLGCAFIPWGEMRRVAKQLDWPLE